MKNNLPFEILVLSVLKREDLTPATRLVLLYLLIRQNLDEFTFSITDIQNQVGISWSSAKRIVISLEAAKVLALITFGNNGGYTFYKYSLDRMALKRYLDQNSDANQNSDGLETIAKKVTIIDNMIINTSTIDNNNSNNNKVVAKLATTDNMSPEAGLESLRQLQKELEVGSPLPSIHPVVVPQPIIKKGYIPYPTGFNSWESNSTSNNNRYYSDCLFDYTIEQWLAIPGGLIESTYNARTDALLEYKIMGTLTKEVVAMIEKQFPHQKAISGSVPLNL
jgi:hypothetical protein